MKYHVMFTLEHGFSIDAMNLKEAESRAKAAIKHMNEPTAKLLSIIVDGYAQPVEGVTPDQTFAKLLEVEIDLEPRSA